MACSLVLTVGAASASIPLPEHPRPDFQRPQWQNLNGDWQFRFDPDNQGLAQAWFTEGTDYPLTISVPFSWGSKLSGVEDKADIGWYTRDISIPLAWHGQRVFVVVGACDWHTTAWLDGKKLGEHQGGYTPFEFDVTDVMTAGETHRLVLRVDDTPHPFKLEGKQGYGRAAGIWQTLYLEARPDVAMKTVHFTPDIDKKKIGVKVTLDQPATEAMTFQLQFKNGIKAVTKKVAKGAQVLTFDVRLTRPRLWSLEDPYLYEVTANLSGKTVGKDSVSTYFGMRKISTGKLPGTDYPYVMLNHKPVYLELTLDQAYHPEGFYTFPSDAFMRAEIQRTRDIGLNGQRIHIKVEVPRKLYWADKLGVLIMADVPNSWGQPDDQMQAESEYALRGMIRRDYNHPAIFSWVNFNETWGLFTTEGRRRAYTQETQDWVAQIYSLTKQLDPTRLVEDNSPCNYDHVATDLNSWHAYLPGYGWREFLDNACRETYPGSPWNYVAGKVQDNDPMFNSECGNVWGYEGSAGDGDWSWDYHIMINEFRRHPQVCGWLYTEHHDVINEWNGYWRYDRSQKFTGLSDIVTDMTIRDFHSPFYIALERELCTTVRPGQRVEVPVYASFMTDQAIDGGLTLEASLFGWSTLGVKEIYWVGSRQVPYRPWMNEALPPLSVKMPGQSALAILAVTLKTKSGQVLHRNFTTYQVTDGASLRQETITSGDQTQRLVRLHARDFTKAQWSLKQWNVLDGLKVNGAGAGYFEYQIAWPEDLTPDQVDHAVFKLEVSAKQLFGKDQEGAAKQDGDFMRGKGTHDPSLNRNAYPMTDETRFPSRVTVSLGGHTAGAFDLTNDSADHRGILSWHSQKRDRFLREAGSYGELISVTLPTEALQQAAEQKKLVIRLSVDETLPGGLAIYGERFGRYPLDPTLVFTLKK
ncbi:MAG: glycoside hydrolase family 2 [Phycisphaerae bacterium]|nr:glycoside hydrolase family 2 [Phycisphaerae bacterium]